ncbi:MAG: sugar ABC transporter permease [Spirochaetaceae bacterium]|nr:sugar ABC transporter permease [Spirochaetaceae bacterium]
MNRYYFKVRMVPYLFVLPFIVTFLLIYSYPIVNSVIMSFQEIVPGETTFIGFDNYTLLRDPRFHTAVWNSCRYTFWTLAVLIPFPILLAVMLNSPDQRGRTALRSIFFIPSLVSVVVAGTVLRLIFAGSDRGMANQIMAILGLAIHDWRMEGPGLAMFLLVTLATWRWLGVNIVYFLSGLQNIPSELYEAARIDGANRRQSFRLITLPLLKPTIIFVVTISIFGGFAMFEESYIFWQANSPNSIGLTIVGYLWRKGFQQGELGAAAAIGVVLLALILSVNMVSLKIFGFRKED